MCESVAQFMLNFMCCVAYNEHLLQCYYVWCVCVCVVTFCERDIFYPLMHATRKTRGKFIERSQKFFFFFDSLFCGAYVFCVFKSCARNARRNLGVTFRCVELIIKLFQFSWVKSLDVS